MAQITNDVLIGKDTHLRLGDGTATGALSQTTVPSAATVSPFETEVMVDFSNRIIGARLNVNRNSGSSTGLGDQFDSSRPTMNSATLSVDFLATATNQSFLLKMQAEFDKERFWVLGRQGVATTKPAEWGHFYLENVDWNASVGNVQTYSCTLKVNSYFTANFAT